MRLVATSDWHGDHCTIGRPRFADVEQAAWAAAGAAIERKADAFLFLGDLCDPDSGPVVFRCARLAVAIAARLAASGVHSVFIPGNHCVIDDGSGESVLEPVAGLGATSEFVHVVSRPGTVRLGGHPPIMCLPFTSPSHGYDPAEEVVRHVGGQRGVVTITHLNVPGIIPGEETTEMPRGREVMFPVEEAKRVSQLMLAGHYHRRQVSPDGVQIVGSLQRLTFGEEDHTPGFLVIELQS
jgi:DNA repair exonuclease SbcCD nuclease subunit